MNDHKRMIEYLEMDRIEEAEKCYKRIKETGSAETFYLLAADLSQLGFLSYAKELYEHILHAYPEESEIKILLAELLVEMGEEEKAILYLDSIQEEDESYPQALLVLADLYQLQGLFEVSEQKLLKANELLPHEPIIYYALGEFYASQGRLLEAVRYYQKLLEEGHTSIAGADLRERLAAAYSAGGAFEEAIPFFEQALEEKTSLQTLFGLAITAYQAKMYPKAIEAFEKLKALDPEYHSLYRYLAESYEQEGALEASLAVVEEGLAADSYQKELYHLGGKIALKLRKKELSEDYHRQALALDPSYLEAALHLNQLLLSQERYEEVIEIIEILKREGETDPQLHWDAAHAFRMIERYKEALQHYEYAYEDLQHHVDFLMEYGYFLREEGEQQKSFYIFNQVLKLDPVNDEVIYLIQEWEN